MFTKLLQQPHNHHRFNSIQDYDYNRVMTDYDYNRVMTDYDYNRVMTIDYRL